MNELLAAPANCSKVRAVVRVPLAGRIEVTLDRQDSVAMLIGPFRFVAEVGVITDGHRNRTGAVVPAYVSNHARDEVSGATRCSFDCSCFNDVIPKAQHGQLTPELSRTAERCRLE